MDDVSASVRGAFAGPLAEVWGSLLTRPQLENVLAGGRERLGVARFAHASRTGGGPNWLTALADAKFEPLRAASASDPRNAVAPAVGVRLCPVFSGWQPHRL